MRSTRILLLALIAALLGCGSEDIPEKLEPTVIPIAGIELSEASKTLKAGESFTLTAGVKPSNTTEDKMVEWETSDAKVATVSNSGVVTAVSIGEATITAKAGSKTATCRITVAPVEVAGIILSETEKEIQVGDSFTLTVTFEPPDATNKAVAWSSSDESVATVDNGSVTGISVGEAVITVRSESGGITAVCEVSVLPVPVSGVRFAKDIFSLSEDDRAHVNVEVLPVNATNKDVVFESMDEGVFNIGMNGLVTPVSVGKGVARVTSIDGGHEAYCEVEVLPFTTDIRFAYTITSMDSQAGGYITCGKCAVTVINDTKRRINANGLFIVDSDYIVVYVAGIDRNLAPGESVKVSDISFPKTHRPKIILTAIYDGQTHNVERNFMN